MKLKKLLAAVTAAALAVTTMAVTSFTASALDTSNEVIIGEFFSGSFDLTTTGGDITNEWSSQWVQLSESNMSNGYDWDKVDADSNTYVKATFSFNAAAAELHNNGLGQDWFGGDIKANASLFTTESTNVTADTDYVAYLLFSSLGLGAKDQWNQKGFTMQAGSGDSGQVYTLKKAELVTLALVEDAPEMALTPETATVEVGKTKTLTAAVTGATGGTFSVTSSDDTKASAAVDTDGKVTVTGVAEGTADITVTYTYNGTETLTKTCTVTVTAAGSTVVPEGTKVTLAENTWDGGSNWQGQNTPAIPGITNGTSTVAEAKEALDSVTLSFKINGALSDGDAVDTSKINVQGILQPGWVNLGSAVKSADGTYTITVASIDSALEGKDDTAAVSILINMYADSSVSTNPIDVYISDVTVNTTTIDTTSPKKGSITLNPTPDSNWWDQIEISEADLLGTLDKTKSVIKLIGSKEFQVGHGNISGANNYWTQLSGESSYTIDLSDFNGKIQLGAGGDKPVTINWAASIGGTVDPDPIPGGDTPGGDTPGGDTPVTPPVVSGNSVTMGSTEYTGWYEAVLTKDQLFGSNTGATTITFTGADLAKVGYNSISAGGYKGIDCTGTVTIQVNDIDLSDNFFLHVGGNAATVVTWSFNGGSSGGNEPSNPTDPSNPSAPSSSGSTYEPPIPSGSTSISVVDSILGSSAASVSFNLGSNAKLDKEVFEALASKGDITVRFNVAGGAYWEISGANVTAAKAVDLGVRMNSNLIPASAVSELAGDKTTIQLSLKHNGDFGFTGVLNVPVGKANDGKFANLYYYHSGKFDFVGSSAISNGRAKFAFSHASNYIIVIDDYAYGEDVSSAAGMTETTETSAVPYVAALVVVSAFAASAVVLKKRLSK